ncbi:hypothetical protein SCLCIDRAFT_1207072 [Scleroderma citrinum Foug A]|uniref:Uncharacterized protein n=1 Tax=Scleroderma citrinum Foug A TaxID=1036808 RepID=A0A0C3B0U1_9AGAM|nr:hypothetical protein SCLCIDRAFT_1207072 [Scleroderma citrinum Foug A]
MDGDVSGFANVVGVHQAGNVTAHSFTPDKMRRQNSRHSSNNSFTPDCKNVAATGVLHLGNTDHVMDIAARACGASGAHQCQDNTCCSSGTFCCNSPYFGCCPNGMTCGKKTRNTSGCKLIDLAE